jgi:hypothetical protein
MTQSLEGDSPSPEDDLAVSQTSTERQGQLDAKPPAGPASIHQRRDQPFRPGPRRPPPGPAFTPGPLDGPHCRRHYAYHCRAVTYGYLQYTYNTRSRASRAPQTDSIVRSNV